MSEEELIETLRAFEKNRVEQLEEPARNLFYAIMKIAGERDRLNNIINELEEWLESESNFWKGQQEKAIKNGWLEFGGKYNTTIIYENAINKLQELKGSDK